MVFAWGLLVSCAQDQPRSAEQLAELGEQRFVTPHESGLHINECMARQGLVVDTEVDEYGGQSGELIGVDLEWADSVIEGCVAELEAIGMMYDPVATPELASAFYDFLIEVADCLGRVGLEVPEPPSRAAFVESRGAVWHPYEAIVASGRSPTRMSRIEQLCPSVPLSLDP